MGVAIEDSGWMIRDMVSWIYASGFPKSLDISKAIELYQTAVDLNDHNAMSNLAICYEKG